MFKIFKKLKYTRNLIYANSDKNIVFSEHLPKGILDLAQNIIIDNNLYDGRVYKAIYQEYKNYYTVYDISPWLLYFRIPILIQAQYVHRDLIEPTNYLKSIGFIKISIPKQFRIPQPTKDIIMECLQKSLPYMAEADRVDEYDFEKYLEAKFLSEWPYYVKYTDEYLKVFSNTILNKFISVGGSNSKTISNIIERTIKSKIEEATSN